MNQVPNFITQKLVHFQQTVPLYCNVTLGRFLVTIYSLMFPGGAVEHCEELPGINFEKKGQASLYSAEWNAVFCV
jgi:hypothetical protein